MSVPEASSAVAGGRRGVTGRCQLPHGARQAFVRMPRALLELAGGLPEVSPAVPKAL